MKARNPARQGLRDRRPSAPEHPPTAAAPRAVSRWCALSGAIVLSSGLTACGGAGTGSLVTSPEGNGSTGFLYVASSATDSGPGAVLQYSIGPDGSLTPQSSPSVPTGSDPMGLAADPSGRYVYVANAGDQTITQYAVGAEGGLTELSQAAVSLPPRISQGGDFSVSIDPSGHYLYVVVSPFAETFVPSPPFIAQYSIGSTGLLTPLAPASVNLPTVAAGALAIDSIGRHAYLGGGVSGVVLQFSIGSDGTLTALALAGVAADEPVGVVLPPRSEMAYVLGRCVDTACDGEVSQYLIDSDASLNPRLSTTLAGSHIIPVDMVVKASGSSAYLLTNFMGVDTNSGKLYPYAIDTSGALVPQGELDTGSAAVAEALNGSNLYVLTSDALASPPNGSGGHLAHLTLGSGGMPSEVDGTAIVGRNPTAMALVIAP
jgi:DNA-binding beta-propeller fold protein YncE